MAVLSGKRDREPTDPEIARGVRFALEWDAYVPDEDIRSTVSGGVVTLEGQVYTPRQKEDAARAVRAVPGVQEVSNRLTVPGVKADPDRSSVPPGVGEARDRLVARPRD